MPCSWNPDATVGCCHCMLVRGEGTRKPFPRSLLSSSIRPILGNFISKETTLVAIYTYKERLCFDHMAGARLYAVIRARTDDSDQILWPTEFVPNLHNEKGKNPYPILVRRSDVGTRGDINVISKESPFTTLSLCTQEGKPPPELYLGCNCAVTMTRLHLLRCTRLELAIVPTTF